MAPAGGRSGISSRAGHPVLCGAGPDAAAAEPGLLRYPASTALAGLRETALHRLMAQHQVADPFKFLIYAELAGAEIGPVQ